MRRALLLLPLLAVIGLLQRPSHAQVSYRIESLVRGGKTVEGAPLEDRARQIDLGWLNDRGVVTFLWFGSKEASQWLLSSDHGKLGIVARLGDKIGNVTVQGLSESRVTNEGRVLFRARGQGRELLAQVDADGKTPALVVGPHELSIDWSTLSMSQTGKVAFSVGLQSTGPYSPVDAFRSYIWDTSTKKLVHLDSPGEPAFGDVPFAREIYGNVALAGASIDNNDEVAFDTTVRIPSGYDSGAVLFRDRDARLYPVAFTLQDLPDGRKVISAGIPRLTDSGRVVFLMGSFTPGSSGGSSWDICSWEKGSRDPMLVAPVSTRPDGYLFIRDLWVNNQNQKVLFDSPSDLNLFTDRLYLGEKGKVTPLLVPGKPSPGDPGSKVLNVNTVTDANNRGERLIVVTVQNGPFLRRLYRMDADGSLWKVLEEGANVGLGSIVRLHSPEGLNYPRSGPVINNLGQIALGADVSTSNGTRSYVLLLTPEGG
jgi:hypothetical protein